MANEITKGAYGFPDPMADKKTKDSKAYILQYNKAIYNSFNRYGLRILFNDKAKYRNLANYYLGLQQIDRYKKRLDVWNEDEPGKDTFLNIDWQVLNLAYKFVNIMVDKIVSTGYDVELESVDPLAVDMRKDMEHTMKAVMENKEWLAQMGIKLNPEQLGFDPAQLPDHSDELKIHLEMSVKDQFAMEGEMIINMHMNNNDFEQVRKEYNRDGVVYGIEVTETRNDKYGNTKIKRISPELSIIATSLTEDFKDVPWGGYIDYMSFEEFQVSAGDQFTPEEYQDIYEHHCSSYATGEVTPMGVPIFAQSTGDKKVSVLKSYYKTNIHNTYVKKKDSRGNTRMYPQGNNTKEKEGQELIRDSYEVVYESRWIIGSDYIYEYGMMNDLVVDPKNPCATRIPLHVIYPNMLNGMSNSVLQSCLPIFDSINVSWYQFQHLMASVIPDGIAIDQDALADIALGGGGKKATAKDLLELYYKKGTYIYSSKGLDGTNRTHAPITPLVNSTHEKAMSHLNNVFTLINILRQLTGMNEGVDASTPSPDALVGTMQIAAAGANSALGYLYGADRLMVKHVGEDLILLSQNAMRRNPDIYANAIGMSSVKFWEANKDMSLRQFGMKIIVRPTNAEWAELYQQVAGALEKGIIDYSDFSIIREMTNLKQARKYMAVVEKRKRREAQQQQEAMMQQQGEINKQAVMVGEQAKQQTLQLEVQLKSSLVQVESTARMAELDKKYGYDIMLKQMELQQKADDAELQARTKIVDTAAKNQSAMDIAKHQGEIQKQTKPAAAK